MNEYRDGLLEFVHFTGKVALNVLKVIAERYVEILNPSLKSLGLPTIKIRSNRGSLSVSLDDGPERLDERIAKIDSARQSLTEALVAMDELKVRAEENKQDLEFLNQQIERANLDKASLSGELKTLKEMAALDSEAVRKVLRLPTRLNIWTERVIAFAFGVLASIIASVLYEYVLKRFI